MACSRTLSTRATLFARRFNPSFTYISHLDNNDHTNHQDLHSSGPMIHTYLAQRRCFGSCINNTSWQFPGAFRRIGYGQVGNGLLLNRYISTSIGEADTTSFPNEVPTVISDDVAAVITYAPMEAVASHALAVNEVTMAASDSAFPIAVVQWASIAIATLLVRGAIVPVLINLHRENVKLALIRPRLRQIKEQHRAAGMNTSEGKRKIKELLKENGVTPFTPYKGICIQFPIFISFILAISNMAEKVPSFKTGGALWFTDLSTPDAMYIFPILMGLSVLVPFELHMRRALKRDPIMMNSPRVFAVLLVPFTMSLPTPIFCYWLTSNMFAFCFGSASRDPRVKKALGIPEIPTTPPSAQLVTQSETKEENPRRGHN